jgi:SAM-dependent methyltransferase
MIMAKPDLARRSSIEELMDNEPSSFDDYRACLDNLARVNRLTLAYRPTLAFLDRLAAAGRLAQAAPIAIVDVGCGAGDMLRHVEAWAKRRKIAVDLTGVDANPRAARVAVGAARPGEAIRWITADVFAYRHPGAIDIIVSSLFTHHLDDAALVRFVGWMEANAKLGWFVNDLHRHTLSYVGFRTWARLARWHRFVQHDGPVSIARAFRYADWRRMLAAASIPDGAARVAWYMPFRLCVERVRQP